MADVLILPGVERRDLVGEDLPEAEVLQAAIDNRITDVVVIGRQRDGTQYVSSSMCDVDKAVGILFAAATWLAAGVYAQDVTQDREPGEPA